MLDMVQSPSGFDGEILKEWITSEVAGKYKVPHELTILSHEELSGHPHGYNTIDPFVVTSNLKQAFPSAKFIIIIRNQFSYLVSLYTFRVAIKGMETRRLERFLSEEGSRGLFEKLEYDRIVEHYFSLFGQKNVLVLPMELLKANAPAFNNAITEFLDLPPIAVVKTDPVNKSTTLLAVLYFWRPFNLMFRGFLGTLRFLHIEPEEEYPHKWLRYNYYSLKRRMTILLNKVFESTRAIDITAYPAYSELYSRYSASNKRLEEIIPINLREYGYPFEEIPGPERAPFDGRGKSLEESRKTND